MGSEKKNRCDNRGAIVVLMENKAKTVRTTVFEAVVAVGW